jgi:hypothetical protein
VWALRNGGSYTSQLLTCNTGLENYLVTDMTFLPYGAGHSHAIMECARCGHADLLARKS